MLTNCLDADFIPTAVFLNGAIVNRKGNIREKDVSIVSRTQFVVLFIPLRNATVVCWSGIMYNHERLLLVVPGFMIEITDVELEL